MKRIKFIFMLLIICCINFCINTVYAVQDEENKRIVWDDFKYKTVKANKVWKITFNKNIKLHKDNYEKVKILDKNNSEFPVDFEIEGRVMRVIPSYNYVYGEKYVLTIDGGIQAETGEKLNVKVEVPFQVEDLRGLIKGKIKSDLIMVREKIDLLDYEIRVEELKEIIDEIIDETPEVFYYEGYRYTYNKESKIINEVEFSYAYSIDDIMKMKREITDKVDFVLKNSINASMSDFQKELVVHDFIVNNTHYDIENLNKGTLKRSAHTIYGVLIEGKAVCSGYAKTMQYFLDKFKIKNKLLYGSAEGRKHVWNFLYLDGNYYHLDVTFDDPISNQGEILTRNYFNITDEMILKNHSLEEPKKERAVSTSMNYFRKVNMYFDSEDSVLEYIKGSIVKKNDEIVFMYKNSELNIKSIVEKSGYIGGYSYSKDDITNVFRVKLLELSK